MRNRRSITEWIVVLTIFVLFANEIASTLVGMGQGISECPDSGKCSVYYYTLFSQIGFLVISIFFVALSFLLKYCPYTKIAIGAFAYYQVVTSIFVFFNIDSDVYMSLNVFGCSAGAGSLLTLFIIQKCLKQ